MNTAKPKKTKKTDGVKPKTGRPTLYSPELRDRICTQLSNGMSLRKICLADDMPEAGTVCRWLTEYDEFSEQYTKAREAQAEMMADQIMDIADEMPLMNPITGAVDGASVNHKRLRIDARKWVAAKLLPKKYGDKLDLNHTGKIGIESLIASAGDDSAGG